MAKPTILIPSQSRDHDQERNVDARHPPKVERDPTDSIYRISGNIDGDFNLADCFSTVKLKFAITYNLPLAI